MKFITRKEIIMLLFLAALIFMVSTTVIPIVVGYINGDISVINPKLLFERLIYPDCSKTYITIFLVVTTIISLNLLKTNLENYINYKKHYNSKDNNDNNEEYK